MKATIIAGVLLTAAATVAEAGVNYRNVDSLITASEGGGQIIVALDLTCRDGRNFVIQTNRNTGLMYKGCAYRESNRIVVSWNDGEVVSYSMNAFTRSTAWINLS